MTAWTWTVLMMALLATVTGLYLTRRQKTFILAHRDKVPERFAGKVSQAAHEKAADYSTAKLRLGNLACLWSLLLLLAWTLGGGFGALDGLTTALGWGGIWTGVTFLVAYLLISLLLDLPLDLYGTFGIEARFGFNRTTPALYFSDMAKQAALMLAFGVPLAWAILSLMQGAGSLWWLYAWLLWTGFSLTMVWAYPTLIAPLFNKFEPLAEGEMKARIEALLARCGFKSSGLFVMDGSRRSSHGNAYFTGLGNAKRIVFFDTLLKQLEPAETEAVLAHELGHFRHGHVRKRLLAMLLLSLAGFALLGWLAGQTWFYAGLGISRPSSHAALALFMLVLPFFTFVMAPLMSHFSRRHEFEADTYAVVHSSGEALISALVKMYEDNASTLTSDPLYSAWHDSHPPAPQRIDHIDRCLAGRQIS